MRPTGGTGWYSTIQAAEDVSTDPSTIVVYPNDDFSAATYTENIEARTVNLTMRSACGPDLTIIDGGGSGIGALLRADNQVFDGFSVTNAGDGLYVNPAPYDVTIKNNKIYGNSVQGINVNNGFNTHIENNEIYNNNQGIRVNASNNVEITNCDIHDNKLSGWGAGILLNGGVHTITDSVIRNNSNTGDGGGIAFNGVGVGTTVTNTTISNNQASGRGGGMYITGESKVAFDKCTITGNRSSSAGGGVYSMVGTTLPIFKNSIIAGNQASSGGFAYIHSGTAEFYNVTFADNHATNIGGVFKTCGISDRIIIRNSIFWGNTGDGGGNIASRTGCSAGGILLDVSYSDIDESDVGGNSLFFNNITPAQDPLFAGNGNYHILTGSPVIDQAHADYAPADDIDGEARPNDTGYEMGADEYYVPVDSTTAGFSTAYPSDSSNTSITVTMPYLGDANENSTYTVDYKLSSDHTSVWTNWVTEAANTASPYTTTITGLIANETYDVRMTYNDEDGVSGKDQRAVSGIDLTPHVNLTTASQSVAEDVGTVTVTATLSWISGSDVTVPFTVSGTAEGGGTDHDLADGNIIVTAGNLTGTTDFTVTDDDLVEYSETVIVTMGTPVNAKADVFFVVHTVTITDNEPQPSVSFTSAAQATADESGTDYYITVQLSAASILDVEVPFTLNDASTATGGSIDYSITESPVIITAGNTNVDITITVVTDSLDEDDETVIVDMGTPTNATQGATTTHTLTITDDDDPPTVTFTSASQATTDESVTDYYITAQLSGASGLDVTVPFTVNGASTAIGSGTDYLIAASPVIIYAGTTTADIIVTIADDTDIEGDETVIVDMDSPTNATQGATTTHTLTITDDEAPPVVDFSAASQSVAEDVVGTVTVTATLDVTSTLDVTVPFTVSGTAEGSGTDHDLADGSITIYADDLTGTKDFTLTDDSLHEPDETVIVTMGTPVNGTAGTTVLHTVTITDNDAAPSVEFTLASQATGGENGTATITAELSATSGFNVTVPFSVNIASTATGGGTDYSITASPVTITAGTTTADIIVTIATDFDIEDDETVIVDMGSPINATQGTTITHTLTITDDDFAGGTIRTVCGSGGASHTTIQEAIGVASDGDRVEVCAGTYSENINFGGKNLTVQSVSGAGSTTIRGLTTGTNLPVVTFDTSETSSAILDGFTIDNQASGTISRGIYISGATPIIQNCIIEGNVPVNSTNGGGGIYIDNSAPTISNTIIRKNTAINRNGGGIYITGTNGGATITNGSVIGGDSSAEENYCTYGGGIYMTGSTAGTLSITNSTVKYNRSALGGNGLYLNAITQTTTITGSTISYNNTTNGHGGAIYNNGSPLSITDSYIDYNSTPTAKFGGGLYVTGANSTVSIDNTSFSSNSSGYGSGIYFTGSTHATPLTISNGSTISFNTNQYSGGGIWLGSTTNTSTITDTTISSNTTSNGHGGGIYAASPLTVTSSTIESNSTNSAKEGGGIYANSTLNVINTLIRGNRAVYGAGVRYSTGTATITNSTITGNGADWQAYAKGGGISVASGTMNIYNSTISGNYSTDDGGGLHGAATVKNSIIWGNTSGDANYHNLSTTITAEYSNIGEPEYPGGTGNINEDPDFVDYQYATNGTRTTAGDFHLCKAEGDPTGCAAGSASPSIDTAGTNNLPSDDIDGGTRPYDVPSMGNDGSNYYDMGSDEYGVAAP